MPTPSIGLKKMADYNAKTANTLETRYWDAADQLIRCRCSAISADAILKLNRCSSDAVCYRKWAQTDSNRRPTD